MFTNVYPKKGNTPPHPFKIYLNIKETRSDGTPVYEIMIHQHSNLCKDMSFKKQFNLGEAVDQDKPYLHYLPISFQNLQTPQEVPEFKDELYVLLEVDLRFLNLKAEIKLIEKEKEDKLHPIEFVTNTIRTQKYARIILGALLKDDKKSPNFSNSNLLAKTMYIYQYVHTNLMLCHTVFNGLPVIYFTPFAGELPPNLN